MMHSTTLFINIRRLVNVREKNELLRGTALADLPMLEDAYLLVEDGLIAALGKMYELDINIPQLPKTYLTYPGNPFFPVGAIAILTWYLSEAVKMNL